MKKCKKYNNIFEKLYNDSLGQWLRTYCFELKWWENFKLGLVENCFNNKKRLKKCSGMRKINFNYCERSSVVSHFLCICYLIYKKLF